jgi:ATP-binding cassette subfamily B protein
VFVRQTLERRYWGRIALLALCAVAAQGVELLGPYALSGLVNRLGGAVAGEVGARGAVMWWLGGLVAAWLGSALLLRAYEVVDIVTSTAIRAGTQKWLFTWLLDHSPRYFQENFSGQLGQKVKQSGQSVISILSIACSEVPRIAVMLGMGGYLLVGLRPFYAVLLLVWAVLHIGLSTLAARRCIRLGKAFWQEISVCTGRVVDIVSNIDVVRSFARLGDERDHIGGFFDREVAGSRRLRGFLVLMRLYQAGAATVLMGVLTGLAARDTLAGTMDVGAFTMVFALSSLISANVQNLANRLLEFFEQYGALVEALDTLTAPHEIVDRPGAPALAVAAGAIVYDDVWFHHADGTQVLRGLNLTIAPGEKVGLVGRSGAGKSTLIKLLRRQFEPQRGAIRIDGQDIAGVTLLSLNQAIAEVPQVPGIFHRPIADNIRYARPGLSDEAMAEAARLAHCHEFIARRAEGYATVVGEQGVRLSGGERQRVAIARALIKDARILVLDEATSSLDSESEHLIQEALWRLMEGRTVIAIAHRLSTIMGMDRIVYLDGGAIVEEGRHAELIARDGAYAHLWRRQTDAFLNLD